MNESYLEMIGNDGNGGKNKALNINKALNK